jgi:hypothetical protein
MKQLGKQSEEDLSFITETPILNYTKNIDKHFKKTDFKKQLSKNSENLVEILDLLVCFNPYFRHSASEALKNPIFD